MGSQTREDLTKQSIEDLARHASMHQGGQLAAKAIELIRALLREGSAKQTPERICYLGSMFAYGIKHPEFRKLIVSEWNRPLSWWENVASDCLAALCPEWQSLRQANCYAKPEYWSVFADGFSLRSHSSWLSGGMSSRHPFHLLAVSKVTSTTLSFDDCTALPPAKGAPNFRSELELALVRVRAQLETGEADRATVDLAHIGGSVGYGKSLKADPASITAKPQRSSIGGGYLTFKVFARPKSSLPPVQIGVVITYNTHRAALVLDPRPWLWMDGKDLKEGRSPVRQILLKAPGQHHEDIAAIEAHVFAQVFDFFRNSPAAAATESAVA
jgi:hypothetical protein